MKREL
jgi:hypothetical protein